MSDIRSNVWGRFGTWKANQQQHRRVGGDVAAETRGAVGAGMASICTLVRRKGTMELGNLCTYRSRMCTRSE